MFIGSIALCSALCFMPIPSPYIPLGPGLSAAPAAVLSPTGSLPKGPADTPASSSSQATTSHAGAEQKNSEAQAEKQSEKEKDKDQPTPSIETWAEYTPGNGFLVGRTKLGELSISGYAMVRYLNQMPGEQTFTDHLGNEHSVDGRNDIFPHRMMIFFKGWLGTPKLVYNILLWSVNTTAQVGVFPTIQGMAFRDHAFRLTLALEGVRA